VLPRLHPVEYKMATASDRPNRELADKQISPCSENGRELTQFTLQHEITKQRKNPEKRYDTYRSILWRM